jgi:hypothetical protein
MRRGDYIRVYETEDDLIVDHDSDDDEGSDYMSE